MAILSRLAQVESAIRQIQSQLKGDLIEADKENVNTCNTVPPEKGEAIDDSDTEYWKNKFLLMANRAHRENGELKNERRELYETIRRLSLRGALAPSSEVESLTKSLDEWKAVAAIRLDEVTLLTKHRNEWADRYRQSLYKQREAESMLTNLKTSLADIKKRL